MINRLMEGGCRGKYITHLSRIRNHLDWYLLTAFRDTNASNMTISEIRTELHGVCGVKLRRDTILDYNARQFKKYQMAPLEWAGDDLYALNENYYHLVQEKVFAPREGKPGRPRKYVPQEISLDNDV